jgi:hypothetical protein
VLFTSDAAVEVGGTIEYVVNLPGGPKSSVSLRCLGKVLRTEKIAASEDLANAFTIAATLERYEFLRS